jgi:hypothetical protein
LVEQSFKSYSVHAGHPFGMHANLQAPRLKWRFPK